MSKVQRRASDVRRQPNRDALNELLIRSGVAEGSDVALRLLRYLALLEKWNARVNLTSTTNWESLGPLFEEAIWAADLYPDVAAAHLDIGSGAGFPALLMRVLRPRMRLAMVEPRGKRAAFLERAAHELGLTVTAVFNGRLEEFLDKREVAEGWDFVSWKALRLGRRELSKLLSQSGENTQFWVFHGARLPLDDADASMFRLLRRETFPEKHSWYLSILRKIVSRETGDIPIFLAK